jgi:hypothetical protein
VPPITVKVDNDALEKSGTGLAQVASGQALEDCRFCLEGSMRWRCG